MRPFFISGIGTGIGKTLVSAILAEALEADYWKPVQAGFDDGTDSSWVGSMISNPVTQILPETYKLAFAASPHLSAKKENVKIRIASILEDFKKADPSRTLIIEGAGGLMVPLNEEEFVIDLIKALGARLILVSRNYLGSINHSLLSAALCRAQGIDVAGWIFNDHYLNYEEEIAGWSGYPVLCSVPALDTITRESVRGLAAERKKQLTRALLNGTPAE